MTRETLSAVVLVWLVGAIVGWFAGWAARTDQNRRWSASVGRRVDRAEQRARDAVAELDAVTAQRRDLPSVGVTAAPEIHLHLPAALGYHDLTRAAAAAVAEQQQVVPQRVIGAGP